MAWNSLPDFIHGIQRAAQTALGVYLKRTCSRVTSASIALGVLNDYALYKSTHSLTHSLTRKGTLGGSGNLRWRGLQVLKRNRETHTRTMWTKAKDCALKTTRGRASDRLSDLAAADTCNSGPRRCAVKTTRGASDMLVSTTRASLTVDDAAAMRDQLNELREENAALKEALDEVRIQTNGQSS